MKDRMAQAIALVKELEERLAAARIRYAKYNAMDTLFPLDEWSSSQRELRQLERSLAKARARKNSLMGREQQETRPSFISAASILLAETHLDHETICHGLVLSPELRYRFDMEMERLEAIRDRLVS